jgi:hypothetical protein
MLSTHNLPIAAHNAPTIVPARANISPVPIAQPYGAASSRPSLSPMAALVLPQSPTLPTSAAPDISSAITAADGFSLNILPTVSASGSVAAGADAIASIALPDASTWYSIVLEVIGRKAAGPSYYVCRQIVEAYRAAAGGAVIHYQPGVRPVESPIGGDCSVLVTTSGNDVRATLHNAAASAVGYSMRLGYTRKPLP